MLGWLSAAVLAASSPAPKCVQIIGTNDVHGHLEPEVHQARPAQPAEANAAKPLEVQQGGLAAFAGYLDVLRKKYPKQLLLLDGGDLFQGTVPSNLSKGAAIIAAFNALGYQGASLGNHEFDFGPEDGEDDLQGAIKKRLTEAKFPFLAANVYDAKSGKRLDWKNLKPSTLVTVNGVKVGIVGAITPDTPTVTVPLNVAALQFRDPADDVKAEAAKLRKQGAKVVVLVAHIGGACTDLKDPNDVASCAPNGEMNQLLAKLPQGTIDVAIAGHTHQFMAHEIRGVAVSEAGSYSHAFGWVEACVDGKGAVTTHIHPPTDVCVTTWKEGGCGARDTSAGLDTPSFLGEPVKPDPKLEQTIAPFLAKVKAQQEAPTGFTTAAPMVRARDRLSSIGLLIAKAIRASAPGADFGETNAGGIRADLPQGPLKFGQIFEVLPFDNRVVSVKLTGAQVLAFVTAPLTQGHGFPQLDGVKLDFDAAHPEASRLTLPDGKPIDPAKTYVLATNDFLVNGGDGTKDVMAQVPPEARRELGKLVRDAFIDYLWAQPEPIQPPAVAP